MSQSSFFGPDPNLSPFILSICPHQVLVLTEMSLNMHLTHSISHILVHNCETDEHKLILKESLTVSVTSETDMRSAIEKTYHSVGAV